MDEKGYLKGIFVLVRRNVFNFFFFFFFLSDRYRVCTTTLNIERKLQKTIKIYLRQFFLLDDKRSEKNITEYFHEIASAMRNCKVHTGTIGTKGARYPRPVFVFQR